MPLVTLACHALATRFEIVLHGVDAVALRAAGEEALEEIQRLEARLSLFRPESEIAHLNALATREPVRVTPELFALLELARRLHAESDGVFDITIAPLMRCWGLMGSAWSDKSRAQEAHGAHGGGLGSSETSQVHGRRPRAEELAEARAKVGMGLVLLDHKTLTVRFACEGVMLDLGAIGKGYAVERAAEILREAGVTSALLHGGTSTVYALGNPPDAEYWNIAVPHPGEFGNAGDPLIQAGKHNPRGRPSARARPAPLAMLKLKDEALSVSAVWGKYFEDGGRTYGHVLDPRTGEPAMQAIMAAVVLPSAAETDALSTALLVRGPQGHEAIARLRPRMRTLLVIEDRGRFQLQTRQEG